MKYLPFIFALLLLVACAEKENTAKELAEQLIQEPKEVQPTLEPTATTVPTAIPAEQPAETVETPVNLPPVISKEDIEEVTEPAQDRTKMYRFLDTFAQKVKSYEFGYKTDKYFVKGMRYKIILFKPVIVKDVTFGNLHKSFFYYDTVYVDRAMKNAFGYCEGHQSHVNTQCSQLELYDLAYPVSFKEYNITLPEDWLFAYLDKEPNQMEENKYYINGRASVLAKFTEIPDVEINFDPGTGLVLRVDKKSGSQLLERHDYGDLVANKVRDVDVVHRSKDEIPPYEAFYR